MKNICTIAVLTGYCAIGTFGLLAVYNAPKYEPKSIFACMDPAYDSDAGISDETTVYAYRTLACGWHRVYVLRDRPRGLEMFTREAGGGDGE